MARATDPESKRTLARSYRALSIFALTAVYYLAGRFGLSLASINASASAVWPPAGIALAALLLGGRQLWPAIFAGAFLVNVTTQGSVATSLGIAAGNTLEGVLAAELVRRFAGGANVFRRAQDILKFMALAAVLSTALSATVGVTSLCLGKFAHWDQFGAVWLTWWLGDMTSNIIVAPAILIWAAQGLPQLSVKQMLEAAILLFVIVLMGYLLFLGETYLSIDHSPLGFMAIPPLLWAAFRFDQRGAITSALLVSSIALWGTLHDFGPFVGHGQNEPLLFVQAFMGISTITALVLAGLWSERKRNEEALRRARDDLTRANAELEHRVEERTAKLRELLGELEHFSYALVHDLRAPLRAMQSFAILAEEALGDHPPEEVQDYLRRIRTSSERMDALVLDALTYNRAVLEGLPLEPVNLFELISGIIQTYPNLQPPRAQIHLDRSLPIVVGNKAGLTQCFSNFLGNAVKFVGAGVHPHVRVWSETRHGMPEAGSDATGRPSKRRVARVWIEDNGIGIPREWQTRIFDMFQKAESGYEGTGVGLAIVRKVVERMSGQVGVESELGKGSRFWIELPECEPNISVKT